MKKKKVLLIGIDGATPQLVEKYIKEGKLPTLAKIYQKGIYGKLKSTQPPLSPIAWSSLATGTNPGKHGILDFIYRQDNSYSVQPIDSSCRKVPTFWRTLSKGDKKVGVYNMPATYPVKKINGFIVGGWLSPYSRRDFTYPRSLLSELEKQVGDYNPFPNTFYRKGSGDEFLAELDRILEVESKSASYLLKNKDWDFAAVVFFGIDLIQHYLWHTLDSKHPSYDLAEAKKYGQEISNYYQKVDSKIASLLEFVDKDTLVIIASDHGAGPQYRLIYLNNWLLKEGYLKLKDSPESIVKANLYNMGFTFSNMHKIIGNLGITSYIEKKYAGTSKLFNHKLVKKLFLSFEDIDWEKTSAYSLGRYYGPIFINLDGREPRGIVKPGKQYNKLVREISSKLKKLKDPKNGKNLVKKVYLKNELYQGPYLGKSADILAVPRYEEDSFFGLSDFGSNKLIEEVYRTTGSHREEGIIFMSGSRVKQKRIQNAEIIDLAPTILKFIGEDIPKNMDGKILKVIK